LIPPFPGSNPGAPTSRFCRTEDIQISAGMAAIRRGFRDALNPPDKLLASILDFSARSLGQRLANIRNSQTGAEETGSNPARWGTRST